MMHFFAFFHFNEEYELRILYICIYIYIQVTTLTLFLSSLILVEEKDYLYLTLIGKQDSGQVFQEFLNIKSMSDNEKIPIAIFFQQTLGQRRCRSEIFDGSEWVTLYINEESIYCIILRTSFLQMHPRSANDNCDIGKWPSMYESAFPTIEISLGLFRFLDLTEKAQRSSECNIHAICIFPALTWRRTVADNATAGD